MIHVTRVHEFVYEQIIEYGRILKYRAYVQADYATTRTRPPTRTLPSQLQAAISKITS